MMYADEEIEGEFNPTLIGQLITSRVLPYAQRAANLSRVTESPIETIMGLALEDAFADTGCELTPQWVWRRYRADWAIRKPTGQIAVVECDGAEFHSSSEHVARDRRRDEEMLRAGIFVYRVVGSAIYREAHHLAALIKLDFLRGTR